MSSFSPLCTVVGCGMAGICCGSCLPRPAKRSTTTYSAGMMKMAMPVAASIPPITAVPMICRPTEPAPVAMNKRHAAENERERRHQNRPQPQPGSCECGIDQWFAALVFAFANSTIRMAFLAARPISITSPICE